MAQGPDAVIQAPRLTDPPLNLVQLAEAHGHLIVQGESGDEAIESERWVNGFEFLPEPSGPGTGLWAPCSGVTFPVGGTRRPTVSYDPFITVYRDERSLFGWAAADYADRALRGLLAHEQWSVENEFWTGTLTPTNPHLATSVSTATAGPNGRVGVAADPTPPPGTTIGTAYPLSRSLAALDQAIADSDAGTGMIHCTPYLLQQWARVYQMIRENGRTYTVNGNLLVPGYGYTGSGPDEATRTVTDGATTNASTTVTSATAAFTPRDVGAVISGAGIPAGTVIYSVTNGTTVVVSQAATATASGVTLAIGSGEGDNTGNTQQWAFATDMATVIKGKARVYPHDGDSLREMSPLTTQMNAADFRAERPWAVITNGLLRAAVLVDTTTA